MDLIFSVTAVTELAPPPQEEKIMNEFPWKCDFGIRVFDDCRFSQDNGFVLQWEPIKGPTPTANTGTAKSRQSNKTPTFLHNQKGIMPLVQAISVDL